LGLGAPRSRKATLRAKRAFPQFSVAPLRVRPAKSGGTPLLFLALPWLPPFYFSGNMARLLRHQL